MTQPPTGSEELLTSVPTRTIRMATVICMIAGIVAVFDFILFGTLLPRISETFNWSTSKALWVSTLVSLGTAIVLFAIGPLVDKMGRRRGMITSVFGTAVSSAASAVATGAVSFVGLRAIGGLSLAEQSINATYLNELYNAAEDKRITRNRGFVFSMVQTAWPLGALTAALFVAIMGVALGIEDWRWIFLIATVPALIVAWWCRKLPESPQFLAQKATRASPEKGSQDKARSFLIFRRPYLKTTLFLGSAWLFNWMSIQTFSVLGTTVLETGKGFSSTNSLLMVAASNLVAVLGYLAHGWLGDRFDRRRVVAIGWLIAAALFTAMLLGPNNPAFVLVTYMAGLFFLLGPYAAILVYQSEAYPTECRATGGAFAFAMSQPGAILGGLFLTMATSAGLNYTNAALVVGSGACLISGLITLSAKITRPTTPNTAAEPPLEEERKPVVDLRHQTICPAPGWPPSAGPEPGVPLDFPVVFGVQGRMRLCRPAGGTRPRPNAGSLTDLRPRPALRLPRRRAAQAVGRPAAVVGDLADLIRIKVDHVPGPPRADPQRSRSSGPPGRSPWAMNGLSRADGRSRNFHPVARSSFLISSTRPRQETSRSTTCSRT